MNTSSLNFANSLAAVPVEIASTLLQSEMLIQPLASNGYLSEESSCSSRSQLQNPVPRWEIFPLADLKQRFPARFKRAA